MATVGNLFINVNARTAAFRKKMKGVRGTIGRLGTGLAQAGKKVALFGAAMGAIALGAITMLTKKGLAAVDTMAKLAQNIGASVKSIQTLRHMATLGGVSIEKMDKAVSKMTRGIGESAVFGIGEANDAFEELGLSAKQLEQDSPDVAFGKIADAINNVGNKARQGILAYKIFGRAGQELVTTLSGGSAAVDAMTKKLEDLGVVIGDEQAQMVEQANDAWADIKLVWEGLGNQLAVNFAPILTMIAEKLKSMVVNFGGMGKVAEGIVKAFMYAGALVLDAIKVMKIGWQGFQSAVITGAGLLVEGTGHAVNAIVNIWHKGAGAIKMAMAETYNFIAGGLDIVSKLFDDKFTGLEDNWKDNLVSMAAGTVADFARQQATKIGTKGLSEFIKDYKSNVAETLQLIGQNLQDQGTDHAGNILDMLADGWAVGKVPDAFANMIENALGEGFGGAKGKGLLELEAPSLKGIVNSLQTAIGGFKIEGDRTERLQQEQLSVEKSQLNTLEQMRLAMATGGLT